MRYLLTLITVLASCNATITPVDDLPYQTCDHLHEDCRVDAQSTGSIYAYIGRIHGCFVEHNRCQAVGIEEYTAIWQFVCPALGSP